MSAKKKSDGDDNVTHTFIHAHTETNQALELCVTQKSVDAFASLTFFSSCRRFYFALLLLEMGKLFYMQCPTLKR